MPNKHHAPHTTPNRIVRLALVAAALAVACAPSAASSIIVDSDFHTGDNGWTALFADYLPEQEDSMNLTAGVHLLLAELAGGGTGFFISGQNLSDSLQMVLVRRLGPEDGVVAGQSYAVTFDIAFASAAQSNCVGIGGAPGESVYLRAGAVGTEPIRHGAAGNLPPASRRRLEHFKKNRIRQAASSTGKKLQAPAVAGLGLSRRSSKSEGG